MRCCPFLPMPSILEFNVDYFYDLSKEGIELPLALIAGDRIALTSGFVDCGSAACLFSNEVGQTLGIDVESGSPALFGPATGGSMPAYSHFVVLEFFGISFEAEAFFAKYPGIQRNLLGRRGFLRKLQFGLLEHEGRALFSTLSQS